MSVTPAAPAEGIPPCVESCLNRLCSYLCSEHLGSHLRGLPALTFLARQSDGETIALSGELPKESDQFRFLRAGCLANLKGSMGLILAKASSYFLNQKRQTVGQKPQTLKIGSPVVLFQEIRIPTNALRRIKMELGTFHPEYVFYIEAGRESRVQRSQQPSRWGSDLNTVVLTCLHRVVFNTAKTVSRKWLSGQVQSPSPTDGLTETLLSRESIPTMLGGDVNVAPPGGRFGYVTGNAKHINNVDEAVQNFLARIGACSQKGLVHTQSGSGIFNKTMQGVTFVSVSFLASAGRKCTWE